MAAPSDKSGRSRTERECMSRLHQMDVALGEMEPQLPDDARALGAEARRRVSFWLQRIAAGGADLQELSSAMAELAALMGSLTERLLLAPWSSESRGPRS